MLKEKGKRIVAVILCVIFVFSIIIPCFAAEEQSELSPDEALFIVTLGGEVLHYEIFDYHNANSRVISSEEFYSYVDRGYGTSEISYDDLNGLKDQITEQLYGSTDFTQYLPESIPITDVNQIESNVIMHQVYDVDGTMFYIYRGSDQNYYRIPENLYQSYSDSIKYEDLPQSESFTFDEVETERQKGNKIVHVRCRFGQDVPDDRRIALIFRCAETYEEYSMKMTPPEFEQEISLPIGTYNAIECYDLVDQSITYSVMQNNNETLHVHYEEDEVIDYEVYIGSLVRPENIEEYYEEGSEPEGYIIEGDGLEDEDGHLKVDVDQKELDNKMTQVLEENNFAPEKSKLRAFAILAFAAFVGIIIFVIYKIKQKMEEE